MFFAIKYLKGIKSTKKCPIDESQFSLSTLNMSKAEKGQSKQKSGTSRDQSRVKLRVGRMQIRNTPHMTRVMRAIQKYKVRF